MATHVIRHLPEKNAPREKTVEISVQNGEINVTFNGEPRPFWLSKGEDEEVRWVSSDDLDFLVDFEDDSPFYESQFNQDSPVSGLVRRNILPNDQRLYKYTVWVGNLQLDPGGGVKP
jgi:hypothetical protein